MQIHHGNLKGNNTKTLSLIKEYFTKLFYKHQLDGENNRQFHSSTTEKNVCTPYFPATTRGNLQLPNL